MKTNYLFLYENQKKVVYYKNKKFYIKINNENYNITKCFQKNTNLINPIYKKKFLLIDSDDDTGKAKKDKFKCKKKEVEVKKMKKIKKVKKTLIKFIQMIMLILKN
tara:strand:- start:13 stop:330 length:318 start_codon:yes stop_codon:yes gene_type:complete